MKLTLLLEKGERPFSAGAQERTSLFPLLVGVPWFLCRRLSRAFYFSASTRSDSF